MVENPDPDLEVNTGIEFPGESLEPYLSASTNLEDDTLENAHLVIEIRD